VRGGGVGGVGGRGGDLVGEDLDFEVWLDDGHFDVEGGDFVGEALWGASKGLMGGMWWKGSRDGRKGVGAGWRG
jgi:hypothetical protein